MKVVILGCGPSCGVPLLNNFWGSCKSDNPKNHRTRSSIAIQSETECWIIDASPDIRKQCQRENIENITGILLTHEHFDHTSGLDELKPFFYQTQKKIPVYGNIFTLNLLKKRSPYLFGKEGILKSIPIQGKFSILDQWIMPFYQYHGQTQSLGFRFKQFAYCTDVSELSPYAIEILKSVPLLIIDCLGYEIHRSHAHLEKTLHWIREISPQTAVLTHMGLSLDYDQLISQLPSHVIPGYDGLSYTIPH